MMKNKGFSLIELMVVLGIVGIIAAIAIPNYQESVKNTRRKDAQAALVGFAAALERAYTVNGSYMGNAVGGNTTNATPLASFYPDEAPLAGNAKFYNLRFTYTSTAYTVFAVPKGAQAGNGNVRLLNTGSRAWDKADDGSYSYDW